MPHYGSSPIDPVEAELEAAREWSREQGQKDRQQLALLRKRLTPEPAPEPEVSASERAPDDGADDGLSAFGSEDPVVAQAEARARKRTEAARRPPMWSRFALDIAERTFGWSRHSRTDRALIALCGGILATVILAFVLAPPPADTGWVMIASTPAGAPVAIDGVYRGLSPFGTSLPVGKHQVDVGRDADVRSQTFYVSPRGDTAVHVELPPPSAPATLLPTGGLEILTQPNAAQVWIDGKSQGAAPVTVTGLAPGPHDVVVKGPTGSVSRKVTVEKGIISSLIMSMAGAAGSTSGWLTINSPVPAEVREGGTVLGTTNTRRLPLSAGEHHLEISNPTLGYRVERTIRIAPSQRLEIALEAPMGTLHVNALPWAEVWIDGRRIGDTPIGNISLPIGNHELLLRHPQLKEYKTTIAIGLKAPVRVGIDLRR